MITIRCRCGNPIKVREADCGVKLICRRCSTPFQVESEPYAPGAAPRLDVDEVLTGFTAAPAAPERFIREEPPVLPFHVVPGVEDPEQPERRRPRRGSFVRWLLALIAMLAGGFVLASPAIAANAPSAQAAGTCRADARTAVLALTVALAGLAASERRG